MDPTLLIDAWQSAARDLGIKVEVRCTLTVASGKSLGAEVLVRDFGGPQGTLVSSTEGEFLPFGDEIAAQGYAYSVFLGDELTYDRNYFIDVLNDWGWTGPDDERPAWSR